MSSPFLRQPSVSVDSQGMGLVTVKVSAVVFSSDPKKFPQLPLSHDRARAGQKRWPFHPPFCCSFFSSAQFLLSEVAFSLFGLSTVVKSSPPFLLLSLTFSCILFIISENPSKSSQKQRRIRPCPLSDTVFFIFCFFGSLIL